MSVISEKDENLTKLIYKEKYIAVKYFTDDCTNCKAMAPVFEKFSYDPHYKKVVFVEIKADDNPIAQQYIRNSGNSIMIFYKDGLLVSSNTVDSKEQMKKFLDELIKNKS